MRKRKTSMNVNKPMKRDPFESVDFHATKQNREKKKKKKKDKGKEVEGMHQLYKLTQCKSEVVGCRCLDGTRSYHTRLGFLCTQTTPESLSKAGKLYS